MLSGRRLPVHWQEFIDLGVWVVSDSDGDIAYIFVGIYLVQHARAAQRLKNGEVLARLLVTHKQKIFPSYGDGAAQLAFCRV